jgi:hypothetical protein
MNLIIGGVVALIVGYLIAALSTLDELGNVLMVIGAIVAVVGVVLLLVNRGRGAGTRY